MIAGSFAGGTPLSLAHEYKNPPTMLIDTKNHVSFESSVLKINTPKKAVGILFKLPMMMYVVGPVAATHDKLAKLRKNPTKPANMLCKA